MANLPLDHHFVAAFSKLAANLMVIMIADIFIFFFPKILFIYFHFLSPINININKVLDVSGCEGLQNDFASLGLPSSSLMAGLALPTTSLSYLDVSSTPLSDSDLMVIFSNAIIFFDRYI